MEPTGYRAAVGHRYTPNSLRTDELAAAASTEAAVVTSSEEAATSDGREPTTNCSQPDAANVEIVCDHHMA